MKIPANVCMCLEGKTSTSEYFINAREREYAQIDMFHEHRKFTSSLQPILLSLLGILRLRRRGTLAL